MQKNEYQKRLEDILNRYGFGASIGTDGNTIHNILMYLFKTQCTNKKTALWGAGRNNTENSHANVIIKKYTTYIQGLSCLIDSLPELQGREFMGYPIISPEEIKDRGIETVIISSKVQSDSIKKDLAKYAPDCNFIDIYDELEQRGIKIYHKFYEESSSYTIIYKLKTEYLAAQQSEKKQEKLKDLIHAYMSIRDIYYGLKYAEEYVGNKYNDWMEIQNFIIDINSLVTEIKSKNALKKEDILIYFIDSLRGMDVFEKQHTGYKAKLLKNYIEKAVVFTNSKSTGVTTYESMSSVISKKYPYEQDVYDNHIMYNFNEFELLKLVDEQGYDIHFYTSEGYPIIRPSEKVKFTHQVYMAEKLWTVACNMAASQQKTFNFVYFPYELHFPLICGFHEEEPQVSGFVDVGVEDTKEFVDRQLEECKCYIDVQMEYFRTFFSQDLLLVLFSDHSQVIYDREEQKPYFMYYNNQERSVGVTFLIKGRNIMPKWNESLVSMYDFNDILKSILINGQLTVKDNEVVKYQYYGIHYKKLREIAKKRGFEDYIDGINCFTSKDYLYIVTGTGVEEVYNLNDRKHNIIDTEEGKKFAELIKEKYDTKIPGFINKP